MNLGRAHPPYSIETIPNSYCRKLRCGKNKLEFFSFTRYFIIFSFVFFKNKFDILTLILL